MPQRINGGLALAAAGAVLLLVSLFLDWFQPGGTAWTVFELNDLLLAALGVLVLGIAALSLIGSPRGRQVAEGSIPFAGLGALIIVVATLIQPPPSALHSSPRVGAWLGLVGAAMIGVGGLLLRARIAVVVTPRTRAAPPRPQPAEPEEPVDQAETQPLRRDPDL
jgi:hypothetical protein